MKQRDFSFRVIIEPEKQGKRTVYNAYCPALRVADYGRTEKEALKSITQGIQLAIECLQDNNEPVPHDALQEQIITIRVPALSKHGSVAL